MSRFGEENFDSDSALDYMAEILDKLVASIENYLEKKDEILGEGDLMPSIDIMLTLGKNYDFLPSMIQDFPVDRWKTKYLEIFDEYDGESMDEEFRKLRREVIVNTFDELDKLAKTEDE